jgi:ATP-dependent DNA helicase RecG
VFALAVEPRTLSELMAVSGRTNRTKFLNQVLGSLLEVGLVEMTIPDKTRSPNHQYQAIEVRWQRLRGGS